MAEWTNPWDCTYKRPCPTHHPKAKEEKLNKISIWVLFNKYNTL